MPPWEPFKSPAMAPIAPVGIKEMRTGAILSAGQMQNAAISNFKQLLPNVSAFPASPPASGYMVYRTDLNRYFMWDGATWLQVTIGTLDDVSDGTTYKRVVSVDASHQTTGGSYAALSVDTGTLANTAVTTGKIANQAVGTTQIANSAVGTTQIASAAVTNSSTVLDTSSQAITPYGTYVQVGTVTLTIAATADLVKIHGRALGTNTNMASSDQTFFKCERVNGGTTIIDTEDVLITQVSLALGSDWIFVFNINDTGISGSTTYNFFFKLVNGSGNGTFAATKTSLAAAVTDYRR